MRIISSVLQSFYVGYHFRCFCYLFWFAVFVSKCFAPKMYVKLSMYVCIKAAHYLSDAQSFSGESLVRMY